MTIKELEQRTGLPRTSVRFYEQEGFLHPERRENNYRDYSEEDARTLKKIKLLRQLSLDLDAIRRLQAGELSPESGPRPDRPGPLEGDRADLERYAQVCQELSRTETSYGELDPEPGWPPWRKKASPCPGGWTRQSRTPSPPPPTPGGGSSPGPGLGAGGHPLDRLPAAGAPLGLGGLGR